MEREKANTFRHLDSHAAQLHKLRFRRLIIHLPDRFQIHGPFRNTDCRFPNIAASVSQITGVQILQRRAGKCLCVREIIITLPRNRRLFFSISLAQKRNAFPYPPDIILLGNDKGHYHLPQILAENPNPASVRSRAQKIGVLFIYSGYNFPVILLPVKIVSPQAFKLLRLAVKGKLISLLHDFQIFSKRNKAVTLPVKSFKPKALTRFADLLYGKIILC